MGLYSKKAQVVIIYMINKSCRSMIANSVVYKAYSGNSNQ